MTSSTSPLVSLQRQHGYEISGVQAAVRQVLAPLGGMSAFVSPGARVLLKPNLVAGFAPERAVTTHPAVFQAVAELAIEAGGVVVAGDSPGLGRGESAARRAGLADVARKLGVEWMAFTPREVEIKDGVYPRLTLAAEALDADVVINLPKLKTHCQMGLTLAVKNLFGTVVGADKFQWHYRAGTDRLVFGRLLDEICRTINPALTILDAIVGMDGNGPTSGTPNPTGFLAAAADPWALDAIAADIVEFPRENLFWLQAAVARGETAWQQAQTCGVEPLSLRPETWRIPVTRELDLLSIPFAGHAPFLGRLLRRLITLYPRANPDTCVVCKKCMEVCPASAISLNTAGKIKIDEGRCIRCYCCHELCPHDAMELHGGIFSRLFKRK